MGSGLAGWVVGKVWVYWVGPGLMCLGKNSWTDFCNKITRTKYDKSESSGTINVFYARGYSWQLLILQGRLLTFSSSSTKNASRASAFYTRSKSRASLIGFVSVLSIFSISVPALSKTQKHVYLWQLLVFLVFLVLKWSIKDM